MNFSFLFTAGQLVEVRFLGPRIWSLYIDNPDMIREALAHPCVAGLNAYITLNEIHADTPDRRGAPRDVLFMARRGQLSSDIDIVRRNWILWDSDSVKPTGWGATDEQRSAADAHSDELEAARIAEGWPPSVKGDSGNGTHRLNRIDLPNDRETAFLLSNLLRVTATKFDTAAVKLDKTVSSAGQITRLYGSRNHKAGRDSSILSIPEPIVQVTLEQIQSLVGKWRGSLGYQKPLIARQGPWTPELIEEMLSFHSLNYRPPVLKPQGLLWVISPCPFNEDHVGSSPAVILTKMSWPKFKCMHNSCQGKNWKDFVAHLNITNRKVFPWTSKVSEAKLRLS
jgi:hypothetical protein